MENNNQTNKDNKKTILVIVAIVMVFIILAGATFAWWQWQSSDANKTNVSITITKPGFTIEGDNVTLSTLMPTAGCYSTASHTLTGKATVVANNNTSAPMVASITLSGKTSASFASSITSHIHWAIKEVSTASDSYSTSNCDGTVGTTYDTGTFDEESVGTTWTDIATTITFDVASGATVTKYYQVYAWIDSGYTATNTGNTVSDPLQNKTISLTFSNSSTFEQVSS